MSVYVCDTAMTSYAHYVHCVSEKSRPL